MSDTLFPEADLETGATISACGLYRYRLWRTWNASLPPLAWLMLNPSTADAVDDDNTIRKCIGFAKRWGHGGIVCVNLFAFRATYPKDMRAALDPVGPENDAAILTAARESAMLIAAWGNHGGYRRRDAVVMRMLMDAGIPSHCLRLTTSGAPWHPLLVPYAAQPVPFGGIEP